ncbi:MAG TPA: hypothetical protein VES02_01050 [Dermatophilaceae bacterium]|nr:hypothetical protein [Dermatophilaceae bacterium]
MNTTGKGMRTLLVAAAAGALVLGSVAGATAAPGRKSNDKPVLQVVNIAGHSPLNVFDVSSADGTTMSVRPLTLRATVRYRAMTSPLPTISVTLDAYSKKVRGTDLTPGASITTLALQPKLTGSTVNTYYQATHLFSVVEAEAMKAALATSTRAYLCISTADVTGYAYPNGWDWSTQTRRRLNIGNVKPARECVKIINVDPTKTLTTKDDVKKLVS